MKILFVLNPSSGTSSPDNMILMIHKEAASTGTDFKFMHTTGQNDLEELTRQVDEYRPDRVVAGGGDGTVQLVARALMTKNITMAILPLGSANGLATALNLPQKDQDLLNVVFHGTTTIPLDLLRFDNKHYSTHLADAGINAMMVKKYHEEGGSGMLGYAKYLLQSINESPLLKYTVRTPEHVYEKEGYMISFANANMYGTGIRISDGSVSDGKFEICNIERIALDDAIKAGLTKFNVFLDPHMFSDVISCNQADIEFDQEVDFQIDGEYIGKINKLRIDVLPSALQVLVTSQ